MNKIILCSFRGALLFKLSDIMKKHLLTFAALMVAVGGLAACTLITPQAEQSSQSLPTPTSVQANQTTTQNNLVALFLVKKDNLKSEFSGEIYPIALYLNGHYVDVSHDVTGAVRDNFQEDQLIALNQQRNVLSAITSFTVLDDYALLGQFNVDKLSVSQFACSTLLVGEGQFTGDKSLPALFEILPKDQAGELKGKVAGQAFDQAWRWTIAISQYTPPTAKQPYPTDPAKYQQALLTAAKAEILKLGKPANPRSKAVVERVALFDLNHDGKPEIFGTVRQGRDPKTMQPNEVGRPSQPTTYVNLWLNQASEQPTVISSQVDLYEYPVTRRPYDVVGTVDVDGNGIAEVIVRNNGYEATSFGIYELQDGQLKEVFSGAGHGC